MLDDPACHQVEAVSPHRGVQEDEMTLAMGETANVLKKTSDGQQEGRRRRLEEAGLTNCSGLEAGECSRL